MVTFPAGMTNASLYILIADDELAERLEEFDIIINSAPLHYLVKTYRYSSARICILDNDSK